MTVVETLVHPAMGGWGYPRNGSVVRCDAACGVTADGVKLPLP